MVNDIREIFRSPSPDTFMDKLLGIMNEVSQKYEGFLTINKDPQGAANCFFVGYLLVSLVLSATENSEISPDKKLFFIDTVVRIIEEQLLRGSQDGTKGTPN
jgi:hypothetical protein